MKIVYDTFNLVQGNFSTSMGSSHLQHIIHNWLLFLEPSIENCLRGFKPLNSHCWNMLLNCWIMLYASTFSNCFCKFKWVVNIRQVPSRDSSLARFSVCLWAFITSTPRTWIGLSRTNYFLSCLGTTQISMPIKEIWAIELLLKDRS